MKKIEEKHNSNPAPKKGGKGKVSSAKSRVKIYKSILDALKKGYVGQMFSTKNADRLYVISKQKWGSDPDQEVGGKIAKGFSPGTIPSKFEDVKGYSVRTMLKHGKQKQKKFKGKRFFRGGYKGKD